MAQSDGDSVQIIGDVETIGYSTSTDANAAHRFPRLQAWTIPAMAIRNNARGYGSCCEGCSVSNAKVSFHCGLHRAVNWLIVAYRRRRPLAILS